MSEPFWIVIEKQKRIYKKFRWQQSFHQLLRDVFLMMRNDSFLLYYLARKGRFCMALACFHSDFVKIKIAKTPGKEFPIAETSSKKFPKRIVKGPTTWHYLSLEEAEVIGDLLIEAGDPISGNMLLNAVQRKTT